MSLANPTPLLNLEQQIDGTNANTWNDRYNANFQRIEQAITGQASVDVSSGTGTLSSVDTTDLSSDSQLRCYAIAAAGNPTGPATIIMPTLIYPKAYLLTNNTAQNVTFKYTNGTGITIIPGDQHRVLSNGSDIVSEITNINGTRFFTGGFSYGIPPGLNPIFQQSYGFSLIGGTGYFWSDGVAAPALAVGAQSGGNQTNVEFFNGLSYVGSITTNFSSTAFNTTSDYRLKTTYGAADSGLLIDAVEVYDAAFNKTPDVRRPMFLAHEVAEHADWAVTGDKDALDENGKIRPQMLDHSALVPAIWAELRSLRRRVAELEAK